MKNENSPEAVINSVTKVSLTPNLAEMFFQAAQPKSENFDLPGVGLVNIVELREVEVSRIRKHVESEQDNARRSKLFGMGMVVKSVRKDGVCVFGENDIDRFADAGNSSVEKLAGVVLRVNGYGVETSTASNTLGN
jgi:hypothetical protein